MALLVGINFINLAFCVGIIYFIIANKVFDYFERCTLTSGEILFYILAVVWAVINIYVSMQRILFLTQA